MLVKIFENNSNTPWVTLTWDEFRVWIADFNESALETLANCRIEFVTE